MADPADDPENFQYDTDQNAFFNSERDSGFGQGTTTESPVVTRSGGSSWHLPNISLSFPSINTVGRAATGSPVLMYGGIALAVLLVIVLMSKK